MRYESSSLCVEVSVILYAGEEIAQRAAAKRVALQLSQCVQQYDLCLYDRQSSLHVQMSRRAKVQQQHVIVHMIVNVAPRPACAC